MKKVVSLLLVVAMVFSICGCKQTTNNENQINYTTAQMTNESDFSKEEFISDIQGYWITKEKNQYNDYCSFINFDRNHYTSGIYCGEMYSDGAITNIEKLENNRYKVSIHCPEKIIYHDQDPIPAHDFNIILSSNDKFMREMLVESEFGNITYQYFYAGTTEEELQKACNELLNTDAELINDAIQLVLNRKIFIHKEDSPFIYTNTINGIESAKAYHYNWVFGQILNDENFSNIKWNQERTNSGNIVTFNAICKSNSSSINVNFLVPDETRIPIIISLKADNTVIADVNSYYNYMNDAEAILAADASASIMIVLLSVTGN